MNKRCVFVTGLTQEQAKKLYGFLENELGIYNYEVWNGNHYVNVYSLISDKVRKEMLWKLCRNI